MKIEFTVLGRPAPQGSLKPIMARGRPRLISQLKTTMPWRQQVGWTALEHRPTDDVWAGRHVPVAMGMRFYFAPPKKMPKGRTRPAVAPDIDKLQRAILDSLKGIMFEDDGQVVEILEKTGKYYGLPERVEIEMVQL